MINIKRFISIILVFVMITSFAACASEKPRSVGRYTSKIVVKSVESSVVAENDKYIMHWDNERLCIRIEDKDSGYIWSTIPNDFYNGAPAGARADALFNSPLMITYITNPNNTLKTINGSDVFEQGKVTVKKVKNGLQVGYFFNHVEISVPIIYKLYDDHFTVTVEPAGILEGDNKIYQVEIAPFLTAIPASEKKDSYLFVPSGSGALMYTDERDGSERLYDEEVYGKDLSVFTDHVSQGRYDTFLPVFGVNRGENALFAIIEEGAASCDIVASAGDSTIGYSNVCAAFSLRGHNVEVVEMAKSGAKRVNSYSDGIINEKCTVAFYPLSGEDAGYSGMAACYRKYLADKYNIKKSASDSPLYLQILGGAMVKESFVGIPYEKIEPTTTLEEAKEIIEDVTSDTGVKPVVQLKGFGQTGVDVGKVGGAFKVNSRLGSWKDVKALSKLGEIFFDFDLVRFDSSGNGFKTYADSAKAENRGTAYQYYYATAAGNRIEENGRYRLLSRNKLDEALDKALNTLNGKGIKGVSLSTLSSFAYSDYRSSDYYSKGNLENDISKMLVTAKQKVNIMTDTANAYAAANSSHVIGTPSSDSGFSSVDAQIPFYRMVFKGITSMASESINNSSNERTELLKAAETGCGLLYTVIEDYSSKLRLSDSSFAKSVYSDNKAKIVSDYKEIGDLLSKVSDTAIKEHKILDDGVNKTVFENGVTVIVNYTDASVETDLGTVEPNGFVYQ